MFASDSSLREHARRFQRLLGAQTGFCQAVSLMTERRPPICDRGRIEALSRTSMLCLAR